MSDTIQLGGVAGHHFFPGEPNLVVARHCRSGKRCGYMFTQKRLVDRAAFEYDPSLGWEIDRWFEWSDKEKS